MTTRRWVDEHGREIEESDRGLVYDLQTLVDRRKVLGLFGAERGGAAGRLRWVGAGGSAARPARARGHDLLLGGWW